MTLNLEVDLTRYDSTISILPLTVTTRIEDPPSASQPDRNVQTYAEHYIFLGNIRKTRMHF